MTQRREMSRERGVLAASLVPLPLPLPLPEAGQVRGSRSHTPGDGSYRTWGLPPNHPAYGGRRAERKPEVTEPRGLDRVALQLMLQRPRVRGTEAQGTSYWRDTDYREGTGEKKLLQEKKKKTLAVRDSSVPIHATAVTAILKTWEIKEPAQTLDSACRTRDSLAARDVTLS